MTDHVKTNILLCQQLEEPFSMFHRRRGVIKLCLNLQLLMRTGKNASYAVKMASEAPLGFLIQGQVQRSSPSVCSSLVICSCSYTDCPDKPVNTLSPQHHHWDCR